MHARFAVPFFQRTTADDLIFAILYNCVARSYYPLALLIWRKKIKLLSNGLHNASFGQGCPNQLRLLLSVNT